MRYDEGFRELCETLFRYQYVKEKVEITPAILEWLYEHSGGILSAVVSLLHDAQEIAILTGREVLDLEALRYAYQQRMGLMHDYIRPAQGRQTSRKKEFRFFLWIERRHCSIVGFDVFAAALFFYIRIL